MDDRPTRSTVTGAEPAGGAPSAAEELAQLGYKQELRRSLSTWDLLVYGLVFMVPIAPWAIFGVVYNASSGMVPLVYVIGLVAMIFTALAYAQMSRAFPVAGSVYAYVGRGVHQNLGFLAGWTILLDYLLVPTLLYVFAAESMAGVFPGVPRWVWIIVFLAVNTTVNYVGISFTAVVNRLFLAAELLFVAIFVVMAVVAISRGVNGAVFSTTPLFDAADFTPGLAAAALSIAVLSFLGFDGIATLAEESRGGRRSAGRAMIAGLLLVATFFIVQTWMAALLVPDVEQFGEDEVNNAFFGIVETISSHGWQIAFLVMNTLAVGIANAVAAQSATSRLLFSMSRDGRLPRWLSHINPRTRVPDRAILLVGALTLLLGLRFVGQIGLISSLVNFGALTAFLLLHVSVVSHHLVRSGSRNWFLHLAVPVIGFCIIGYVLLNAGLPAQLGGLVWLVVGAGVLLVYRSRNRDAVIAPEHAASDRPTLVETDRG
ncbi:APC family permease [Quadrisphaera sp. DSM 44207]|uniref:APC family permease n=1 Tax=Quadrisphaera sp. DSM 44207 TaxID=1881057 RepID=UPI00088C84EB|nr:APC family permease [Quadrisphaera sp. DSM 44207]SDQ62244.1 Amino acid transporter [Quadrisphaera sp. DSM 44207]